MNPKSLRMYSAEDIVAATPFPDLIDGIAKAYSTSVAEPQRSVHEIVSHHTGRRSFMVMPAWDEAANFGIKLLSISEGSLQVGEHAIAGMYILFDRCSGRPVAIFDAEELTARRTAAVAALATAKLAPIEAETALIVGAGRLSLPVAQAICVVRPIKQFEIWSRNDDRSRGMAEQITLHTGIPCTPVPLIPESIAKADIITTLTPSREPLIHGRFLNARSHLNLIGAFRPDMRETDSEVFLRAERIFVDNSTAIESGEAGDIVGALAECVITASAIDGDLTNLLAANFDTAKDNGISVFKSVGSARQDLAIALMCIRLM